MVSITNLPLGGGTISPKGIEVERLSLKNKLTFTAQADSYDINLSQQQPQYRRLLCDTSYLQYNIEELDQKTT